MIFVLGVWAFLRALLGLSTAVTLENVALRHQLMAAVREYRVARSVRTLQSDAVLPPQRLGDDEPARLPAQGMERMGDPN